MRWIFAVLSFCCVLIAQAETPVVIVSISPQKYFVEQIAGDLVDVTVMVRPGFDPASYEPTAQQLRQVTRAQYYFTIGVPFESAWLPRFQATNQNMMMIDSNKYINKIAMEAHHHEGEDHAHHHDEHIILDPHTWLSPSLVRLQAMVIRDSLQRLLPEKREEINRNYLAFADEINQLDDYILQEMQQVPTDRRSFLVFHPAWGYFALDYDLHQMSVELEGKTPGPAQLAELINIVDKNNISVLFNQPEFSRKDAQGIARALGVKLLELDPLAENWTKNMRYVAKTIAKSIGGE